MILHDQIKEFGIPLIDGGVLDQPFIFMQEYRIVSNMIIEMEIIDSSNVGASSADDPLGLFTS